MKLVPPLNRGAVLGRPRPSMLSDSACTVGMPLCEGPAVCHAGAARWRSGQPSRLCCGIWTRATVAGKSVMLALPAPAAGCPN